VRRNGCEKKVGVSGASQRGKKNWAAFTKMMAVLKEEGGE